jgi:RNA polymerase sigma-70 factor (ECF subfamily)
MPQNLAEVLMLAYFHQFAYRDIAEVLSIPLGTVKSRLHSAVSQFGTRYRARVQEREPEPQD